MVAPSSPSPTLLLFPAFSRSRAAVLPAAGGEGPLRHIIRPALDPSPLDLSPPAGAAGPRSEAADTDTHPVATHARRAAQWPTPPQPLPLASRDLVGVGVYVGGGYN